jgi:hypothetical protein
MKTAASSVAVFVCGPSESGYAGQKQSAEHPPDERIRFELDKPHIMLEYMFGESTDQSTDGTQAHVGEHPFVKFQKRCDEPADKHTDQNHYNNAHRRCSPFVL